MQDQIEFYCEFASPYGYLASTQIEAIAAAHEREMLWRPILLGPIFKTTGAVPLAHMPLKAEYMVQDIGRFARLLDEPIGWPSDQPTNGLYVARAFYYLDETDPESAWALYSACYRRYWVDEEASDTIDSVVEVADALGLDPDDVRDGMEMQETKDRVRQETDAAMFKGVFGSPYIIVDGEPFWGLDRLEQVNRWLETGGW